jgi:membrane-associated phospholipid phosphatase
MKQSPDCLFPMGDWDPERLRLSVEDSPALPWDWRSRISLPSLPDARLTYECEYLFYLQEEERPSREAVIRQQASNNVYRTTKTVQSVVGALPLNVKPYTWKALGIMYDSLEPATYYFKRLYRRGRPGNCCDGKIRPMFPKGDDRHPAHPAYPSGHSAQAHAMAYFYARLFPPLTDQLLNAAADIARNREVAGLHYPSDSQAGQLLAGQVVDMLFSTQSFEDLANLARAEWSKTSKENE